MDSVDTWVKSCLRKKRMLEKHADAVIARARQEGVSLYKYSCPHCFQWHVTKKQR